MSIHEQQNERLERKLPLNRPPHDLILDPISLNQKSNVTKPMLWSTLHNCVEVITPFIDVVKIYFHELNML